MTDNFGFCNSVFRSLFVVVCLSGVICLSTTTAESEKLHFSGHPLIGRLFKADAHRPRYTSQNSKSLNFESKDRENLQSSDFGVEQYGLEFKGSEKIDLGERFGLDRESRSKTVVLGGVKYEVDSSQDKIKKQVYEVTKKPVKRTNQSVRSRVRRSESELKTPVTILDSEKGFNTSSNNSSYIDESSLKRSYAQKAFKRRIEELFTDRKPSGLSEEEINKTKNLRKQLLNIYVRGKQNKYYNHSNTTKLYRTDLIDEDNKSEKNFLRLKIDIPIANSSDLDWIPGIQDLKDNDIAKGKGRETVGRNFGRLRVLIIILLIVNLVKILVVTLLFKAVKIIALKGLWVGLKALAMATVLVLKALFHDKRPVVYEVRSPPTFIPQVHVPHHVHDYGYHHGYHHPEYHWSRNDGDSYMPQGGWRAGERLDHSSVDSTTETSYSTIKTDESNEKVKLLDRTPMKTTNCSSSNPTQENLEVIDINSDRLE